MQRSPAPAGRLASPPECGVEQHLRRTALSKGEQRAPAGPRTVVGENPSTRLTTRVMYKPMHGQNSSMPVTAWRHLGTVAIAACGVTISGFPIAATAALPLVMITLVPAAIMLVSWG